MKKILLAMAIVAAAAIAGNSQDKKWNIGIGGGVAVPTSVAAELNKTGFNTFANVTYSITPKLAVGGEYNITSLSGKTIEGFDLGTSNISAFLVKGRYTFTQQGLRPYLALNLGWYRPEVDPGEFGYSGDAGIQYGSVSLAVRYHVATSDGFEYLQVNLGYTFRF